MRYIFIFSILFTTVRCFPDKKEELAKIPKEMSLLSVSFGSIKKENVHGFKRVDYPNQVSICITNLAILCNQLMGSGRAIYVSQTILTKNNIKWHYEAYMPLAAISSNSNCFDCCIYEPSDRSAPKDHLIRGNIKSYSYSVDFVLNTNGERTKLFSGERTNL